MENGATLYSADYKTLFKVPGGTVSANYTVRNGVEVIGANAFENCKEIKAVSLPATVRMIDYTAFIGSGIVSIAIQEGLLNIRERAFAACKDLETLTLPASVTDIEPHIAGGCSKLTAINVKSGNTAYKSIDGVLFTADGKTIQEYPEGKPDAAYSIPEGVIRIEDWCFSNSKFATVEIPNTVTHIGYDGFNGCSNLTEVTVPVSVSDIGPFFFSDSKNITSLKVEWSNPNQVTVNRLLTFSGLVGNKNIVLYVPTGTKSLYQAADGWEFFPDIREYNLPSTALPSIADMGVTIHTAGSTL